jgi:hypothetical protein
MTILIRLLMDGFRIRDGQVLRSADCVFDASLVPGTCLERFIDFKTLNISPALKTHAAITKRQISQGNSIVVLAPRASFGILGPVSRRCPREKESRGSQNRRKWAGFLPFNESRISRIQIWVDHYTLCQKMPNDQSYSVEEIRKTGLSAPNTCGVRTQERVANQFVVFARPQAFYEKVRR